MAVVAQRNGGERVLPHDVFVAPLRVHPDGRRVRRLERKLAEGQFHRRDSQGSVRVRQVPCGAQPELLAEGDALLPQCRVHVGRFREADDVDAGDLAHTHGEAVLH